MESPHAFNLYIDYLRHRLDADHPLLCKLMDCYIALLLYAEDAKLPADSAEGLQIAATIEEQFFNDRQPFVAIPKTYVTVLHAHGDTGVVYDAEDVKADGLTMNICIYGMLIAATRYFKYMGVHLNEHGDSTTHIMEKINVFQRATNML